MEKVSAQTTKASKGQSAEVRKAEGTKCGSATKSYWDKTLHLHITTDCKFWDLVRWEHCKCESGEDGKFVRTNCRDPT
jgi:hypothetical protein